MIGLINRCEEEELPLKELEASAITDCYELVLVKILMKYELSGKVISCIPHLSISAFERLLAITKSL